MRAIAREKIAVMVETTSLSRWLWYLRTYIQQNATIAWNRTKGSTLLVLYVSSKTDFSMCLQASNGKLVSSEGSFSCAKVHYPLRNVFEIGHFQPLHERSTISHRCKDKNQVKVIDNSAPLHTHMSSPNTVQPLIVSQNAILIQLVLNSFFL